MIRNVTYHHSLISQMYVFDKTCHCSVPTIHNPRLFLYHNSGKESILNKQKTGAVNQGKEGNKQPKSNNCREKQEIIAALIGCCLFKLMCAHSENIYISVRPAGE